MNNLYHHQNLFQKVKIHFCILRMKRNQQNIIVHKNKETTGWHVYEPSMYFPPSIANKHPNMNLRYE